MDHAATNELSKDRSKLISDGSLIAGLYHI
jgi:hypothetical protein